MPMTRLPGGSLRDEVREPIYDTLDINNGDTIIGDRLFFSDVQGKSLVQTNLRQNGLLESGVSFRMQGLAIDVQNTVAANYEALPLILEHSALTFRAGEKDYWKGAARFAAGRIYSDVSGKVDAVFQQYGGLAVAGIILSGKHVVELNPLQSFDVKWTISGLTAAELVKCDPAADTKLRFVCSLKGLRRRPVQ